MYELMIAVSDVSMTDFTTVNWCTIYFNCVLMDPSRSRYSLVRPNFLLMKSLPYEHFHLSIWYLHDSNILIPAWPIKECPLFCTRQFSISPVLLSLMGKSPKCLMHRLTGVSEKMGEKSAPLTSTLIDVSSSSALPHAGALIQDAWKTSGEIDKVLLGCPLGLTCARPKCLFNCAPRFHARIYSLISRRRKLNENAYPTVNLFCIEYHSLETLDGFWINCARIGNFFTIRKTSFRRLRLKICNGNFEKLH